MTELEEPDNHRKTQVQRKRGMTKKTKPLNMFIDLSEGKDTTEIIREHQTAYTFYHMIVVFFF